MRLREPEWRFDPDELAAAFNNRTRAIVINSPNNPTGKVFTRDELQLIAELCQKWDVLAISDEIYERIVYRRPRARADGVARRHGRSDDHHRRPVEDLQRDGLAHRLGDLAGGADRRHPQASRFPHRGGADAVSRRRRRGAVDAGRRSTRDLASDYEAKRNLMLDILGRHGFTAYKPGGAYYVMADVSRFGFSSDSEFAQYLVKEIGVATVPGSSFYIDPAAAPQTVRFCFSKRDETLHEAMRLAGFGARGLVGQSLQAIEPDAVFFGLELKLRDRVDRLERLASVAA